MQHFDYLSYTKFFIFKIIMCGKLMINFIL